MLAVKYSSNKSGNDCSQLSLVINTPNRSLTIEWLDSEKAAAYLGISVATLRNMASNGQIPFYKLGRRNRYRKDELDSLMLKSRKAKLWE